MKVLIIVLVEPEANAPLIPYLLRLCIGSFIGTESQWLKSYVKSTQKNLKVNKNYINEFKFLIWSWTTMIHQFEH